MRRLGPAPTGPFENWVMWLGQLENRLAWQDVTFENSWANVTGRNSKYKKDIWGEVKIVGRINTGTSGTAAFTLPEGFRPYEDMQFICAGEAGGSPAVAYVTIDSSGVVTPTISGASIEVSLDGITFIAEK